MKFVQCCEDFRTSFLMLKDCKVKWGHHLEEEATWEREDGQVP
jgi:hypothetical protein